MFQQQFFLLCTCCFFSILNGFILSSPAKNIHLDGGLSASYLKTGRLEFPDGAISSTPYTKEEVDSLRQQWATPFRMNMSQNLLDGWTGWLSHHAVLNYFPGYPKEVFRISFKNSEYTNEQEEFIDLIGGGTLFYDDFLVYSFKWNHSIAASPTFPSIVTPWARVPNYGTTVSVGSFCKLVSGSISNFFLEGATLGEWRLCGEQVQSTSLEYFHMHPHAHTDAGEVWIAMPAVVFGPFDFSIPKNWRLFPAVDINCPVYRFDTGG